MKALVVGGGVAGLATAIALRRVGIDVDVFERAPEIRDVGAGKTLWHNGVQALRWLGVADELRAAGSPVDELRVLSWKGRTLFRMPVGKFGTSLAIQRQDVLDSLAKVIAPRAIRTDARCVGFEQGESHVTAHFEDGSTARGDFLVGADGIFSTVRKGLFPDWEPRYAGHVAWRGIAGVGERGWKAGVSYNWYGRAKHFALIPLRDSRIFWYGTKNLPPDAHDGGKDDVVETFRDLGEDVAGLIRATPPDRIVRTRLYDLSFRRRWSTGRVVLVGDAAHAMRPNLGQGACTAIEDAVVLAQTIRGATDIPGALRGFVRSRRRRVAWIHRWSEITSRSQLLENAAACRIRDVSLRMQPGPLLSRVFFRPIITFRAAERVA